MYVEKLTDIGGILSMKVEDNTEGNCEFQRGKCSLTKIVGVRRSNASSSQDANVRGPVSPSVPPDKRGVTMLQHRPLFFSEIHNTRRD